MSHVVVVSTDFRRVTVKVSPGMPLLDVLQEACVKFKVSSDKFNLKCVLPPKSRCMRMNLTRFSC